MRWTPRIAVLLSASFAIVLVHSRATSAWASKPHATVGEVVRFDKRIDALIPRSATIELLASGFEWSEGPLWIQGPEGGYPLSSDLAVSRISEWKTFLAALIPSLNHASRHMT